VKPFSIYANTPEECRGQICAWLYIQSQQHRIAAGNAVLARTRKAEEAKSETYREAADYLLKVGIVPISNG
jgi:hypothetical protein